VAVTAGRRRDEQAVLLERHGLEVELYPLLETGEAGTAELRELTRHMAASPPDFLVANTGYGMRSWFALAEAEGLLEPLVSSLRRSTIVVARGAKALGELRRRGLQSTFRAPGETLGEVVDHLLEAGIAGRCVVVQLHGEGSSAELSRLAEAGARVVAVPVYHVAPAAGGAAQALAEALSAGALDAVTFTAAPQVDALMAAARRAGCAAAVLERFNTAGVVAACIGEVCAARARRLGIAQPVVPEHPRLGSLAATVASRLLAPR
jgi:uroporphyrinogen-III synthase